MARPGLLDRISPRIVAATLVVAVAGAVSGAAIGTHQPLERGVGTDQIPEAGILPGAMTRSPMEKRPPNHYPLVTPKGTVPVADLALRSRLRNQPSSHWNTEDEYGPMDAEYADELSDNDIEQLVEWTPDANKSPDDTIDSVRISTPDSVRHVQLEEGSTIEKTPTVQAVAEKPSRSSGPRMDAETPSLPVAATVPITQQ